MPNGETLRIVVDPNAKNRIRAILVTNEEGKTQAIDPETGQILARPPVDVDAFGSGKYDTGEDFNPNRNIVSFHVRDEHDHNKVTRASGMDAAPNTEAETAMALIDRLSRTKIGGLIRCVVYDEALRGVHLEKILTHYGYIPVVKVALAPTDEEERVAREAAAAGPKFKELIIGSAKHTTPAGTCEHLLCAVNGKVIEVDYDEGGKLAPVGAPCRQQVKRDDRADAQRPFYFNVGYRVECPNGSYVTWVVPHGRQGDQDTRGAENIRIFPEDPDDEVYSAIFPRRNDGESVHSRYKKVLPNKRALSLGGNRTLLEMVLFAITENADTWYRNLGHQTRAEGTAA